MQFGHFARTGAFAASMLLLAGCPNDDWTSEAHIPDDQSKAGSVNLAVTLVAPWATFVESLKPGLLQLHGHETLDGDSAYKTVIPQTNVLEEKLLDALGVSAKLGLPTSSITRSATSSDNDGTVTGSSSVTKERGPGTPPECTGAELATKSASGQPGVPEGSRTVAKDPMLAYNAATALYQEVQLLNRYVQNAAQKHGYYPYLVRLQIGVMPNARSQPYDVFTTLSFFPEADDVLALKSQLDRIKTLLSNKSVEIGHEKKFKATLEGIANNPAELKKQQLNPKDVEKKLDGSKARLNRLNEEYKGYDTEQRSIAQRYNVARNMKGVITELRKAYVLPLLVTDNLEGTLRSRSAETLRQLSFALSFLIQGFAGNVGLDKVSDKLKSALGTDINGLLTVGQVNDNSILVRLGAARQPGSDYGIIPRTHNISLLLMVPNEFANGENFDPSVKVVGRSTFRHATKGTPLKKRDFRAEHTEVAAALAAIYPELSKGKNDEEPKVKLSEDDTHDLLGYIFRNDFPGFQNHLTRTLQLKKAPARVAWIVVTENLLNSELSGANFDLPRRVVAALPGNTAQAVLFLDDGKSAMVTRLTGGRGMVPERMQAALELGLEGVGAKLPIFAKKIEVGDGGRNPVLTFDSAKAWNVGKLVKTGNKLSANLFLCEDTTDGWHVAGNGKKCDNNKIGPFTNIYYRLSEPPPPDPLFKLIQPTKVLTMATGEVSVTTTVHLVAKREKGKLVPDADKKVLAKVRFTVEGGDVTAFKVTRAKTDGTAETADVAPVGGDYVVAPDGIVYMTVSNIAPKEMKISLKAEGLGADDKPAGGKDESVAWTVTASDK